MAAFVTGGGGFIGRQLVRRLRASGTDVRAIARSERSAAALRDAGCEVVVGDVLDAPALADALRGCDVAYHLAGDYRVGIRAPDRPAMEAANVTATASVLDAALAAGVGRVVHVSTINAFGDTGYRVVDETYERPRPYRYVSFYDETKHRAHPAAREPIAAGAPVLVAMPGGVYGPGDHTLLGGVLAQAAEGRLRALTFGDLGLNMAHVEDIAAESRSSANAGGSARPTSSAARSRRWPSSCAASRPSQAIGHRAWRRRAGCSARPRRSCGASVPTSARSSAPATA
jgi:dihydroflavonol-4-reductase